MHSGNRNFLADMAKKHDLFFVGRQNPKTKCWPRVLELGSLDINGSARDYIRQCTYFGVDIVDGPGVDLVMRAEDTSFGGTLFDLQISVSMIEHNPTWREALRHNLQWMRDGAMVVWSWGGEGNSPHEPYPHAAVSLEEMRIFVEKELLDEDGKQILCDVDLFREEDRYPTDWGGVVDLVAFVREGTKRKPDVKPEAKIEARLDVKPETKPDVKIEAASVIESVRQLGWRKPKRDK